MYQEMLKIRKSHPGLGGTHEVNWVAAPQGVVRFTREPIFELIANTTAAEVVVQTTKTLLLSSQPDVSIVAGKLVLPANCTVWLTI
jgi:alpha-glucosidase